ncbi:DMT family transporter [Salininema proteolyticum]|uniref:DMT family transporter n=1 Tax=Salininema proteolyticum TaxID=1607685 RepID=A0ABV8TUD1_9ACTN
MSTSTRIPTPLRGHDSARRGLLFLTATGLSWGTTGAAADLVYRLGDMGPAAVSFWRHLGGLVLLGAFTVLRPRRGGRPTGATGRQGLGPLRTPPRRLGLLIAIGVGMAVFQTAYFAAVEATGVAVATIVTLGSGPVLTALGGRALLAERVGGAGAAAMAGALLGLGVLVGANAEGVVRPSGVALGLLSAGGYAAVTLLSRSAGRGSDAVAPAALTLWSFGVGAAVLFPLAWLEGLLPQGEGLWPTAGVLLYMALFTTALAYPLYFAGTARVCAATASVMMLLEPATAALLAVAFLGERLTAATATGTALLLASIVGLALAESRRRTG